MAVQPFPSMKCAGAVMFHADRACASVVSKISHTGPPFNCYPAEVHRSQEDRNGAFDVDKTYNPRRRWARERGMRNVSRLSRFATAPSDVCCTQATIGREFNHTVLCFRVAVVNIEKICRECSRG
jgi:hypothetical protein